MPMGSGFWIDETGTYYITSGDWSQYVSRMSRAIQSPIHSTLIWAFRQAGISGEVMLRLPSIVFMGIAALLFRRLSRLFVGKEGADVATILFVALPAIQFEACQARPYALAMALSMGLFILVIKLFRKPTWVNALVASVVYSLLIYTHAIYSLVILIPLVAIVGLAVQRRLHLGIWLVAASIGAVATLCSPIAPYYWGAARNAGNLVDPFAAHTHPFHLSSLLGHFLGAVDQSGFLEAVVLGLIICLILFWKSIKLQSAAPPRFVLFLASSFILVIGIYFLMSQYLHFSFLEPRYYLYALPVLPIFAAALLKCVKCHSVRLVTAGAIAAILVYNTWGSTLFPHPGADWKLAFRLIAKDSRNSQTPVLLNSGLAEANSLRHLQMPEFREFISAPATAYPLPNPVFTLPRRPNVIFDSYVDQIVNPLLISNRSFYVVCRTMSWVNLFQLKATSQHFSSVMLLETPELFVVRFEPQLTAPEATPSRID